METYIATAVIHNVGEIFKLSFSLFVFNLSFLLLPFSFSSLPPLPHYFRYCLIFISLPLLCFIFSFRIPFSTVITKFFFSFLLLQFILSSIFTPVHLVLSESSCITSCEGLQFDNCLCMWLYRRSYFTL